MEKHVVTLSSQAQKTIFADVYQRRHIEACGVLIGNINEQGHWQVEQVYPLRNTFASPVYFEFDPEELLTVELSYPGQIIGVYHSHPTGFAGASGTDRKNMQRVNKDQQIPWVWLIICGPFDEKFVQQSQSESAKMSMIAYHHYEQEGLRQVSIKLERAAEEKVHSSRDNGPLS